MEIFPFYEFDPARTGIFLSDNEELYIKLQTLLRVTWLEQAQTDWKSVSLPINLYPQIENTLEDLNLQ